jgi:hypothetical protein
MITFETKQKKNGYRNELAMLDIDGNNLGHYKRKNEITQS